METNNLPVAIIGAGPIGLAAAAHLLMRGQTPLVFEAGPSVGAAVLKWGHVRLFSPWRYLIDREAASLLATDGWQAPDPEAYPTGRELVEHYLAPLANTLPMMPHLRLGTRVVAVTRQGIDKMKTPGREQAPFVLRLQTVGGEEQDVLARAVIDASGTYETPNPLGANGIPALGEEALREHIFYGIPAILGAQALCERIAILDHGKLIAVDTPEHLKQTYGGSVVELETAQPSAVVDDIRELSGVKEVIVEGTRLQITTQAGSAVVPQIINLVTAQGELRQIAVREPNLDEIFLRLTGTALRD